MDYGDRLGRTECLLGRTRNVMEGAARAGGDHVRNLRADARETLLL